MAMKTRTITREEVRRHTEGGGAKLVEVLSKEDYDHFHLPGAINVPLGDDFDERIRAAIPDQSGEVIVYCQNSDCPASMKAARRMEELGYENVHDYESGKIDWKEAGFPIEN